MPYTGLLCNMKCGNTPDSKVDGANMGPIWGRQDPGGPHVGPINFAIWDMSWFSWNTLQCDDILINNFLINVCMFEWYCGAGMNDIVNFLCNPNNGHPRVCPCTTDSNDIKHNGWVTVNNKFLVTSEVICQWFSRVTKSWVKIIGKSPHEWPKNHYSL